MNKDIEKIINAIPKSNRPDYFDLAFSKRLISTLSQLKTELGIIDNYSFETDSNYLEVIYDKNGIKNRYANIVIDCITTAEYEKLFGKSK